MDTRLKKQQHNLKAISDQLGKKSLLSLGIKSVKVVGKEYLVEADEGTFRVMDFIDIRYDFLGSRVRILRGNEHVMFNKQIEIMLRVNRPLADYAWSK